jgi:hypothetical protein
VRLAYADFIETAAMALAIHEVASSNPDLEVANSLRFRFRNREASDSVRHYFRFLDQLAHHLFEISDRNLLPGKRPKDASFHVVHDFVKRRLVGSSRRINTGAAELVRLAARSLTPDGWKLLHMFRNIDTHRYVVGIDHISYGFSRNDGQLRVRPGGRLLTIGDPAGGSKSYSWYGMPDIEFEIVAGVLRVCMRNAREILLRMAERRLLLSDSSI